MMRRSLLALVAAACSVSAFLAVISSMPRAQAAPEPAVVPITWEFTFQPQTPQRLIITATNGAPPQTYWYMRYKITNDTGKDLLFTPDFQLLTDTGQILESGKDVPAAIFDHIKALYKNPLMDSPIEVLGKLLQGADNARESVAIFADVDPNARIFTFQVAGLSGETAEVSNPLTGQKVILHKTLVLEYQIAGEAKDIEPQPQLKSKHWVMK